MNKKITKDYICNGVSRALIEFGYPDATPDKIAIVYDEYKAGKRFPDLSFDIIGGFAESQFKDVVDLLGEELP